VKVGQGGADETELAPTDKAGSFGRRAARRGELTAKLVVNLGMVFDGFVCSLALTAHKWLNKEPFSFINREVAMRQ